MYFFLEGCVGVFSNKRKYIKEKKKKIVKSEWIDIIYKGVRQPLV